MTRTQRIRTQRRPVGTRVLSLVGTVVLAFAGLALASPASAVVTVDSASAFDVQCSDGAFRVNGGGVISSDAGDSVTSYLRVDGIDPVGLAPVVSEGDKDSYQISSLSPIISGDDVHLVEWVLNGAVHASGKFSYLESCGEPEVPEATVTFTDAVCSADGVVSATAVVEFAEGTAAGAAAEATATNNGVTETYTASMADDGRAVITIPVATDSETVVAVTQRYRPTLTAPVGAHTYEQYAGECAVATPTPTPIPTPTLDPSPAPSDNVEQSVPAPVSVPTPVETATQAVGPQPAVALPSASVTVGGSLALNASGFTPDEELEIWMHSTPVKIGVAKADATGKLIRTATLPVEIPPGAHHLEVRGAMSGSVFAPVAVNDDIAFTGFDAAVVTGALTTVFVLVLGGVAVVLLGRRARSEARY